MLFDDRKALIHSNLDNALENGYDVSGWTTEDVISDLMAFADDCIDLEPDDMRPHVESWLAARRNVQ